MITFFSSLLFFNCRVSYLIVSSGFCLISSAFCFSLLSSVLYLLSSLSSVALSLSLSRDIMSISSLCFLIYLSLSLSNGKSEPPNEWGARLNTCEATLLAVRDPAADLAARLHWFGGGGSGVRYWLWVRPLLRRWGSNGHLGSHKDNEFPAYRVSGRRHKRAWPKCRLAPSDKLWKEPQSSHVELA